MLAASNGHLEVVDALRRTSGVEVNMQAEVGFIYDVQIIFVTIPYNGLKYLRTAGWTHRPHAGCCKWTRTGGACASSDHWSKCEPAG